MGSQGTTGPGSLPSPLSNVGSPAPLPTASELVDYIRRTRIADLRDAVNRWVAKALTTEVDGDLSCDVKRLGTSTLFRYPPECYERTESGDYRYPDAVRLLEVRDLCNQYVLAPAVERQPSISKTEIIRKVLGALQQRSRQLGVETRPRIKAEVAIRRRLRDVVPGTRGPKSRSAFDPRVVAQAHEALVRENPHWGCRAACETLVERLAISKRTVKTLLKRGQPKTG
jgi:hypothetical protein